MKLNYLLASVTLIVLLTTLGCGTAPRPTPAPTLAPVVITQIVTATPPLVTDTPAPPVAATTTLTTTSAITTTPTTIAQARPSNTTARPVATATRRPNTATPTKAGTAAPTGIPSIAKYKDPVKLVGPNYEGNNAGDRRDERHYGDALVFEWFSNGGLGEGECYLVHIEVKSNAGGGTVGDSFMQCDNAETSKASAQTARFILNKPTGAGPTYAALIPGGGGDLSVFWSVIVARNDGQAESGGFYFPVDGTRHKVTFLSPGSTTFYFPLKGAP